MVISVSLLNAFLSASSSVGDDSNRDESESGSGSISIDKESDSDSSCEEVPISKLVHSRVKTVGLKRKAEEGPVGKGKEIAGGVEPRGPKKLKTLKIPTFSCLRRLQDGWIV